MAVDPFEFLSATLTPEFLDDPYPHFRRLRATAPILPTPFGVWLLSAHGDVEAVLRDSRLSNDSRRAKIQLDPPDSPSSTVGETIFLFKDPPDHTRLRNLVASAFSRRQVQRLRTSIEQLVDSLIESTLERTGQFDVIGDLAQAVPVHLICRILGVPDREHAMIRRWSHDLAASTDPQVFRSVDGARDMQAAASDFSGYLAELLAVRRRRPGDDLLSHLAAAERAGCATEREAVGTALALLLAGHESTANLIGNGILALLRYPDQLARVRERADGDLHVVDELLRYDSPIQLTRRITVDDYRIRDTTIPPGETVVALLGAANRDPAVFPDADRLDVDRSNAHRHVAFGSGAHYCVGAALGRLGGGLAITTLVRRYPRLELAGPVVRQQRWNFRGLDSLPVSVGV